MNVQGTMKHGRRMHTGKAFLQPAKSRKNLKIVQGAHVQKILFDNQQVAYGVEYVKGGIKQVVRASKEVIVSAGAIGSPQLLILSGVGPEDQLKTFNIKPIAILPGVGENFMDHYGPRNMFFTSNKNTAVLGYRDVLSPLPGLVLIFKWFFFGSGLFTSLSGMEATGFIKTNPELVNKPDWPDAQIIFAITTIAFAGEFPVKDNFALTDEVWNTFYQPLSQIDSFSIWPYILNPKSRGTVRLNSSDPNVHPNIDPKYFSNEDDMKAIIDSMKKCLALGESNAFKPYGVKFYDVVYPGCEQIEFMSDEYLECMVRGTTFSNWHYSGTCKMGPETDDMAVVDADLRVHKVRNLRVVDASIMPYVTSGNTNAPCIMIGEKASDLIKRAHGFQI